MAVIILSTERAWYTYALLGDAPAQYEAPFLSRFSNSKRGEASLSDYAETRSHEKHDSSAAKVHRRERYRSLALTTVLVRKKWALLSIRFSAATQLIHSPFA